MRDLFFLNGGGEMGAAIRIHDWDRSPIGSPGAWPVQLRSLVALLLASGQPMFVIWGADRILIHNDAYIPLLGGKHPGALGRPFFDVWAEARHDLLPLDAAVFAGDSIHGDDITLRLNRHGALEEAHFAFSYTPIRLDDGAVEGMFCACTETTNAVLQRHNAEQNRMRLAQMFDQGPSFMALLEGPEHRIELANAGYFSLIGGRDVLGKTVAEALPDAAAQGFVALLDKVFTTGVPFRSTAMTYAVEASPGGPVVERVVDFIYQPLTNTAGDVTGIFVEGAEITERARADEALRKSEEKLRTLNEELERRVEERTRELMQAQEALRQAQKMEAIGQLTGGIAHDFNNLLTGVTGSLELMRARLAQGRFDAVDRYLQAADGAAKRAAVLTQRLLAFSRRQTLDPKPVDVNRLIAGMEELIRRTVGPDIEIVVVGAAGTWPTLIDASQLDNALLNLCINGRDAMPGGGRLTIETANKWLDERGAAERDLAPGQYVSLCVTDTGTGMSPEVIARAFDPFFTTKPIGQGTGLGLSMIYGFVRQSGGQIRVYSELGHGTTMCLYLPRHHGGPHESSTLPSSQAAAAAQAGETVLVVDDEPTIRMLVTEVLEEAGYGALEAEDGPAALRILETSVRLDLLITDVGLPGGMNGRQVADAARLRRPDLKVLFITGYAENAAVGNGHLEPGMALVTKPFAMTVLGAKIRDMLKKEDGSGARSKK